MTYMIRARMVAAMRLHGHDYMTDMTNIQAARLTANVALQQASSFRLATRFLKAWGGEGPRGTGHLCRRCCKQFFIFY